VGKPVLEPVRLRLEPPLQRRHVPARRLTSGAQHLTHACQCPRLQVSKHAEDADRWAVQVCCCCCARAAIARYAAAGPEVHSAPRTLPGPMRPLQREPQFVTSSPPVRL